jgi:HYDIN/CFA65/VesB-like, Ig-like domain
MLKRGLAMLAWLAFCPAASAFSPPRIYWADRGADTIGTAGADGTAVHENFIVGATMPLDMAVDGQHIYWVNGGNGTIARANLDGEGVNERFIPGAASPEGIAVDSQHIYWTNVDTNTIGEANLDGTGVDQSFIRHATTPTGVAVDGRHVYWANDGNGTIGRANLDGTGIDQSFVTGVSGPAELAVDGQHIYWSGPTTIGEANLDGTGVNNSLVGATNPFGLALDGQRIYWTEVSASKISGAELNGPLINRSLVTVPNNGNPFGVAVSVPVAHVDPVNPFATTAQGTLSVPETVTISNTGQADLSIDALSLAGPDPGDFPVTSNGCLAPISPGQSCQLTIGFAPQTEGSRSATLEIASNDFANSPHDVPLSGTAVAPAGPSNPNGPTGSQGQQGTAAGTGTGGSTGGTGGSTGGTGGSTVGTGGTTGLPGASAKIELLTCTVVRRHRHAVRKCRGRAVSGDLRFTSGAQATLTRGRRTYAAGVGAQLDQDTIELVVRELRPVRPGPYTLTLHRRRITVDVVS